MVEEREIEQEAVDKAEEIKEEPAPETLTEKLERENVELRDKWLRIAAEFENFRRRTTAEKSDWIRNANQRLVLELCDVTDNFERALHNAEAAQEMASFRKGIELIYKQIENILKREGVEKIKTEGASFDPAFHDALAHIPSELAENTVAAVIQNGYTMNGKVIRAARVAVANGENPQTAESNDKKKKNKKK
ncbi:MAG: nucleotide exchange factor GrpE [Candidatus Cloacimonetes bacterium]|nr:nucleotide exchange factor GrpE [Candidatus Cloacimonadota bacterium]